MSARNSRQAKARRREQRAASGRWACFYAKGVCHGCGRYRLLYNHSSPRLCAKCGYWVMLALTQLLQPEHPQAAVQAVEHAEAVA